MTDLNVSLLGSQKAWLYGTEHERMLDGGWGVGKTHTLCLAGFLLSHNVPDNFGFIGRASGKDLHTTTIKSFFDDVCPPEFIVGKPKKVGQSGLIVTIKCDPMRFPGATSQIYFDYIIDKQTGKSHLAGGNWGWFAVDQAEEISRADWVKLKGRLRRMTYDPKSGKRVAIKTHALGVANPNGHDWIYEDFFEGGDYVFDVKGQPKVFWKSVKTPLLKLAEEKEQRFRLGVAVRSEENAKSNGGFSPDEYFADQRRSNPPEFVARYMDCSFDDFSGKIYAEYNLASVHNIEPFKIPEHWPWGCVIDPGGSVPWGVGVWRMDEQGNKILIDSAEDLYKPRVNPNHVTNWLKKYTPVEKTRYIVDYQNIPVMVIFQEAGIFCESAVKDVRIGLNGSISQMHVNPDRALPSWYKETQPSSRYARFAGHGSPQVFAFNTCKSWSKEHDNYIWDPVKKNVPKDGQRDDHCDQTRYWLASNPAAASPAFLDPYREFRKEDIVSAQHLDSVDKEMERYNKKRMMQELQVEDPYGGSGSGDVEMIVDVW